MLYSVFKTYFWYCFKTLGMTFLWIFRLGSLLLVMEGRNGSKHQFTKTSGMVQNIRNDSFTDDLNNIKEIAHMVFSIFLSFTEQLQRNMQICLAKLLMWQFA